MKIKKIKIYEFDELSDTAKKKAIENLWDCNVDYEWWEHIYDSARSMGVVITSFDTDRHEIGLKIMDCEEVAKNLSIEYLTTSPLYKIGNKFVDDRIELVKKYSTAPSRDVVDEEHFEAFDLALDYLECDFTEELRNEYLSMLRKEFEYQTSEEQIIETIKANGWTFTIEGKLQN